MRYDATFIAELEISVYQDIEPGYHAMHNDPGCDDHIGQQVITDVEYGGEPILPKLTEADRITFLRILALVLDARIDAEIAEAAA